MYDQPRILDMLATPGTAAEIDVLERIYRRHGPLAATRGARTVCLEPACGTGRNLRVLAGRGWRTLGFDLDAAMVAYARASLRRRGLSRRARVFRAPMVDFSARVAAGTVHLSYIPDNSLRHLASDRELLAHLEGVARCLVPGGLYVVGLSLTDPRGDPPEEDVWTAIRGRCKATQLVSYLPPGPGSRSRRERVLAHTMIERPRGTEHHDHVYDLRTYTERQWLSLLRRSPFARATVLDRNGRDRGERSLPYQLEILVAR